MSSSEPSDSADSDSEYSFSSLESSRSLSVFEPTIANKHTHENDNPPDFCCIGIPNHTRRLHTTAISAELRQKLRGVVAGQDYSLVLHPTKDSRNTLQLTMDGHGESGELYAVLAGEYLATKLEQHWDRITKLAHAPAGFEATDGEALLTDLFAETDDYLRGEVAAEHGGTTATICMIIDGCTIITVNVGDTPAMLVREDGSLQMLTTPHSAESPEEYARYRVRCSELGVKHHEFVYNRFNCPGGSRVPGPNGCFAPVPIFKMVENGQAVPIPEHCEYIGSFGYHGGVQSIRKYVVRDATGTVIGTQPDKLHCNWGSTVAGRPQNTRMLGAFEEKELLHLDAKPSINVVQIDPSCGKSWLLVASDGITDANWFQEIASQMIQRAQGEHNSAQHLCQGLVLDTIANAREHGFKFSKEKNVKGEHIEYPAWDDMCATLIELSACT